MATASSLTNAQTQARPKVAHMFRTWARIKKNWQLYLLLALPVAWLLVFAYYPMYGAQIAFRDFLPGKPILQSEWIGLANFQRFFESPMFVRLMRNTLVLSIYSLAVGFPIPIILALSLNPLRTGLFKRSVQMLSYATQYACRRGSPDTRVRYAHAPPQHNPVHV